MASSDELTLVLSCCGNPPWSKFPTIAFSSMNVPSVVSPLGAGNESNGFSMLDDAGIPGFPFRGKWHTGSPEWHDAEVREYSAKVESAIA
jgi:hypothetical protein